MLLSHVYLVVWLGLRGGGLWRQKTKVRVV